MGKILHRYVFREILVPFALGLGVFTFVLLLARLLKLIELVVNRGIPALHVIKIFLFLLPAFLEVTVPMAMLLAILVAFGRLSADSEIVAIRSSGVSLYQLVPPVATFVAIVMLITGTLAWYGRPWGNRALRTAMWDIARSRATAGLKPQIFNDDFPGLIIYAEQIDSTADQLERVMIADDRDPSQQNTVFARSGYMISDAERETVTLRLLDGTIHTTDPTAKASYQTAFRSYDVNLDLRSNLADVQQKSDDPKELTIGQLREAIAAKSAEGKPVTGELVEYYRKFSIPFACIVFGLIAMPLGVQAHRAVRSRGFAVSLAVIFSYYILLSMGQGFAEQGRVAPIVGLWLPNLVLGTVGLVLMWRAGRELPLFSGAWIERLRTPIRIRMAALRRSSSSTSASSTSSAPSTTHPMSTSPTSPSTTKPSTSTTPATSSSIHSASAPASTSTSSSTSSSTTKPGTSPTSSAADA